MANAQSIDVAQHARREQTRNEEQAPHPPRAWTTEELPPLPDSVPTWPEFEELMDVDSTATRHELSAPVTVSATAANRKRPATRQIPVDQLQGDYESYRVTCSVRGCRALRICGIATNDGGTDEWCVSIRVGANQKCIGKRRRQRIAAAVVANVDTDASPAGAIPVDDAQQQDQDDGSVEDHMGVENHGHASENESESSEENVTFFPAELDAEPATVGEPEGIAQRTVAAVVNVFRALSPANY